MEHIARTQPQRKVIVAHADRRAQDHALRETVLHVGRQIDDFTAYTWYESVDPADHRSNQGLMDLSEVPLPEDVQVFTCGPLHVADGDRLPAAGDGGGERVHLALDRQRGRGTVDEDREQPGPPVDGLCHSGEGHHVAQGPGLGHDAAARAA